MDKPMRYLHELSDDEFTKLLANNPTIQFVLDNYMQPDWCKYPEACAGVMGCWSLVGVSMPASRIRAYEDCARCEYRK